jgi:small subunit ribosomal protein S8
MSASDPIADMVTAIRNAQMVGLEMVELPHSNFKTEMARILKREGYVTDYVVEGGVKKSLRVYLKYGEGHAPVIRGIKRESKAGLRRYAAAQEIPWILGGMGVTIVSTSAGLMTGKESRARNLGGEIVCSVW